MYSYALGKNVESLSEWYAELWKLPLFAATLRRATSIFIVEYPWPYWKVMGWKNEDSRR